ncbi:hypothetical protein [Paenibacillus roseipurpureus]|uniref:Uncharacterized protein n=1 Tax=Paenibacillus roseopurpureus TaxID=2918901 RepID=A0AA96RM85_9BACL|nr:hypothetical protein [Paenibacillus sp. MBLB1832]WNR46189.1 hypothetical protein MJB10_08875 [Paenibacillus sp. MBLB1832]
MYLDKLNRAWSSQLASHGFDKGPIVLTNTTKLPPIAGRYMLEFSYQENKYHLYHVLGEDAYELRKLESSYHSTTLGDVFDFTKEEAKDFLAIIHRFMLQNYEGIQTSVDASEGLEQAMERIKYARLGIRTVGER